MWSYSDQLSKEVTHPKSSRTQSGATAHVDRKRLRIARELHDVISHSIGTIGVQAGVARQVLDQQPEQARDASRCKHFLVAHSQFLVLSFRFCVSSARSDISSSDRLS